MPINIANKTILMKAHPIINNKMRGKSINLTEVKNRMLNEAFIPLWDFIFDKILITYEYANTHENVVPKIVFTGGGTLLFHDHLQKKVEELVEEDPNRFNKDMFIISSNLVFDNAIGYFIRAYIR